MMNRHQNKTGRQCPQQSLNKIAITIAMVVFSWLSVGSEVSRARTLRTPPGPKPRISDVKNSKTRATVTINFREFTGSVGRKQIVLERQTAGSSEWLTLYSSNVVDHRFPYNPFVSNYRFYPGAKYVYHDMKDLVAGTTYRYRVRVTIPYNPVPSVLLSGVRTITFKEFVSPPPIEPQPQPQPPPQPTPQPTPTPEPTLQDVVTKTIYLKSRFRHYLAVSKFPGDITQIEVSETDGQPLQVYFIKPGYDFLDYIYNPDATVMLTSGQTSTPEQIRELFVNAHKKPYVKFVAYVTTSQGNRPKSISLKVSSIDSN